MVLKSVFFGSPKLRSQVWHLAPSIGKCHGVKTFENVLENFVLRDLSLKIIDLRSLRPDLVGSRAKTGTLWENLSSWLPQSESLSCRLRVLSVVSASMKYKISTSSSMHPIVVLTQDQPAGMGFYIASEGGNALYCAIIISSLVFKLDSFINSSHASHPGSDIVGVMCCQNDASAGISIIQPP